MYHADVLVCLFSLGATSIRRSWEPCYSYIFLIRIWGVGVRVGNRIWILSSSSDEGQNVRTADLASRCVSCAQLKQEIRHSLANVLFSPRNIFLTTHLGDSPGGYISLRDGQNFTQLVFPWFSTGWSRTSCLFYFTVTASCPVSAFVDQSQRSNSWTIKFFLSREFNGFK